MSVVVRMEMPTLEKGCKIAIGNEYMFCQIEARWCNFYELGGKCPSWCPIVCQLPEGHGRLVDANDVNNHILGYVDLRDCPTIVQAERSEI